MMKVIMENGGSCAGTKEGNGGPTDGGGTNGSNGGGGTTTVMTIPKQKKTKKNNGDIGGGGTTIPLYALPDGVVDFIQSKDGTIGTDKEYFIALVAVEQIRSLNHLLKFRVNYKFDSTETDLDDDDGLGCDGTTTLMEEYRDRDDDDGGAMILGDDDDLLTSNGKNGDDGGGNDGNNDKKEEWTILKLGLQLKKQLTALLHSLEQKLVTGVSFSFIPLVKRFGFRYILVAASGQQALKEHPPFMESSTGKALLKTQTSFGDDNDNEEDVEDQAANALKDYMNDMGEENQDDDNRVFVGAIKKKKKKKPGSIFDAILNQQHEQQQRVNSEPAILVDSAEMVADRADVPLLGASEGEEVVSPGGKTGSTGMDVEEQDCPVGGEDDEFGPYKSDLAYLEDQIALMDREISLNAIKERLKKGEDDEDDKHRYGQFGYPLSGHTDPNMKLNTEKSATKLEGRIKMLSTKIKTRLLSSKQECNHIFRLEQLCQALQLTKFEKQCILCMVKAIIMPRNASTYPYAAHGGDATTKVRTLIDSFCCTLEEKMKCRSYFYKSSTLMKEGILTLTEQDFMTDVTNCNVVLDRRLFDYVVGLDTEMSELVDGSHLYMPNVNLDDVILPPAMKQRICNAVFQFDTVQEKFHTLGLDEKIMCGRGQVLLFYGESGVGKTMMANALATKLQKSVLEPKLGKLVNFPYLGSKSSGAIIKYLFREARLNRSLLFFDECESLFMSRVLGGQSFNMILSELERFEGLCILATNRAHDLDEAMYRRITLAIEFRKPDSLMREQIWRQLRPPGLPVDEDVDFGLLGRKYELVGGTVKNAWLQSIHLMVQSDSTKVTQDHLMQAASEQVRGQLSMGDFDRRVVPTAGIESMVLSSTIQEVLKSITQYSQAQSVLFGQWGFDTIHRSQTGVSALFTGPPGTGKTMAAEAIGFDLGRPLLVVNVAELVSKWVGETGKNLQSVFDDAKKRDAVLVFDEAEGLFATRSIDTSSSVSKHDTMNVGLLLQYIENFSGICILITNMKHVIDDALFRRFRFVLDFEMPDCTAREEIWKTIVPNDCPIAKDVDWKQLAIRYELCGGEIKNALLRAATTAASRPSNNIVTMADLKRACDAEETKRCTNNNKKGQCEGFYT